jgi:hypothetical protein
VIAPLVALARTTFVETLRAPVFVAALAFGLLFTAIAPALSFFALGKAQAFSLDLGSSSAAFALLFVAAASAGSATSERLRDGTATLVLAGPVGRATYIVGTWLGVGFALGVAGFLLALALVFAARVAADPRHGVWLELGAAVGALLAGVWASRRGRAVGPSVWAALAVLGTLALAVRFVVEPRAHGLETIAVAQALLLTVAAATYAALGIALAVVLPPAAAGASTILVAFAGAALPAAVAGVRPALAVVTAAVVPDLQLFSLIDAAYQGSPVSPGYLLDATLQGGLHAAGALAIATLLLDRRELG